MKRISAAISAAVSLAVLGAVGCSGGRVSSVVEAAPAAPPAQVSADPAAISAATTRFQATTLVGHYEAPTGRGDACSFAVDQSGNARITWAGFGSMQGVLLLPAETLTSAEQQSPTQARYEAYYHKAHGTLVGRQVGPELRALVDAYSVILQDDHGLKQAVVLANGLSADQHSVTCSTVHDTQVPWRTLAAHAGTWVGQRDGEHHLGNVSSCTLVVGRDGSLNYTDTAGRQTSLTARDWALHVSGDGTHAELTRLGIPLRFQLDWAAAELGQAGRAQVRYVQGGHHDDVCRDLVPV